MSVLFMDSFDAGDSTVAYKPYTIQSATPNTLYGLHGKGLGLGDSLSTQAQLTVVNTDATYILSANVNIPISLNTFFMRFFDGTSEQGRLYHNGTTSTIDYRHIDGTVLCSGPMTGSAWHHIALKVLVHNTAGTVEIWVDGVSIASATGVDTYSSGGTYINRVIMAGTGSSDINFLYVDDLVIQNGAGSAPYNDYLGVTEVTAHLPSGNGNSSGLTGSDADSTDNYQLVDEDPPVTTDYTGSGTEGDKDTYAMGNLSSSGVTVYGVQANIIAAKSDTGAKFMRPVVRSNSVDYNGTSVALAETYAGYQEIWEDDPAASAAWTAARIDALELGMEVRDS